MPSSVTSSNYGELATLVNGINGRSPSPTMSTTTTLSPPSPVMRGGGGGKHSNIISADAMADVKSKIEKLASELRQQQKQRCRQSSNSNNITRPILPHLNTDSITTTSFSKKRPALSPFSRAKSHQLQQQQHQQQQQQQQQHGMHYIHPSTPHPGGPAIPGLEPTSRSLSDLHNERSYLLHNLQTQGERATRLYQRYAHLEAKKEALKQLTTTTGTVSTPESATGSGVPSTAAKKKKIKKDMSLLRSRIAESTQQEQLIMLRLGEIHVELVNRGRWVMTHQCQQQQLVYSPMSAVVDGSQGYFGQQQQWHQQYHGQQVPATPMSTDSYSTSPVGGDNGEYHYTPTSVLSPLSPSFVPGGMVSFFDEDIWTRPSQSQEGQEQAEQQPAPEHHFVTAAEEEQHQQPIEPEENEHTPKPTDLPQETVPLSAFTPSTPKTNASAVSTSLPSEHLSTPITPGRIPWDEYPSDSEDDGSFDSFDGSSFTPIGVFATRQDPFDLKSGLSSGSAGSGSGSGSGVMVSEPEPEPEADDHQEEQLYGEGEYEEGEEEDAEKSDDSASEPGDLLSEHQRRKEEEEEEDDEESPVSWKGSNRRLSMPTSLKNIWPAALKAVGVQMGFAEGEEEVDGEVEEMRLDSTVI
ncbi:hypothetical protein B0T20DRAFT_353881 [Sordaria brevicollis]|uniref:Uncharacterized protein n=1 Tax=Sordaria brevicollis TaxID=83679 RepID=A0AAE0PEQ7_SORBR|nr:hypothetical protein B0T20DRAFT_353881 [Sordaria brevicollis]